MKKKIVVVLVLVLSLLLIAACSQKEDNQSDGGTQQPSQQQPSTNQPGDKEEPIKNTDPVTITLASYDGILNEEQFKEYVVEPVKARYPHITVERFPMANPRELVAAGTVPDIFSLWFGNIHILSQLEALQDLEPLMKAHNFDANKIDQATWETLQTLADSDVTRVAPFYYNMNALLYNKDIFDRFGQDYPVDDMTWEEVRDLAIPLNRVEDGEQYFGLWTDTISRLHMQLNIPIVKADGKANFLADEWADAFNLWRSINEMQQLPHAGTINFHNGQLGMAAAHINVIRQALNNDALNWDMATYPQHASLPGVSQRPDGAMIAITPNSKNKDAAFLVLETMLSEEVQTKLTRRGNMTVLQNNDIKQQFGADVPGLADKRIEAILKPKFASAVYVPQFETSSYDLLNASYKRMVEEGRDTNTALRELNEEFDILLAEFAKTK